MSSSGHSSHEEEDDPPVTKKPRLFKCYGDIELADAVLQVGNTDVHVNKMALASKSSYFKRLFLTEESKAPAAYLAPPRCPII